MKKILPLFTLLILIGLVSFKDYNACSGEGEMKALACVACHPSSISSDVFVLDGKTEAGVVTVAENNSFELIVRLPNYELENLQLYTGGKEETGAPRVKINETSKVVERIDASLFMPIGLKGPKTITDEYREVKINYTFNEALSEDYTVVIQGVVSNQDGTTEGDLAFYKEHTFKSSEVSFNGGASVNEDATAFFSKGKIELLSFESEERLRVLDLQGRVVLDKLISGSESVDASGLPQGLYFVVFGETARSRYNFSFLYN